jgi:hypothetical protein
MTVESKKGTDSELETSTSDDRELAREQKKSLRQRDIYNCFVFSILLVIVRGEEGS